jgi:glycosyltransferase involved in cell wall biosynthesis
LYYPEAHTRSQNLYLRWSTRHNARSATCVLADSKATRQDLIRHYQIPPDKIAVVYPGRDENLSRVDDAATMDSLRRRYGLPGPYLLYVGTLQPRKNLVRLVQAFALLLRSLPSNEPENAPSTLNSLSASLCLVLAGKAGWLGDEIVAQVRKLELKDRVILPGYIPDSDLPALLSGALAFVYPSLYEGFGLPVLEAMACGTPVVCSNSSSLPEVAGDAALLVDPLAPEALAEALRRVIAEDGLRREMVQRGARQVRRFSWQRSAQEAWAILQEVGRGLD